MNYFEKILAKNRLQLTYSKKKDKFTLYLGKTNFFNTANFKCYKPDSF